MSVELSRRQAKRVDEHLRKSAVAQHKRATRRSCKQTLNTMDEYEYCSNIYCYSTTSSKYFF